MATTTTKRGPYARSLRRREEIARAVLELVDEVGHEAVTTAMVAQRSGIPEATVLYHFPTKDHLLIAALERQDEMSLADAGGDTELTHLDLEVLRAATASLDGRANRHRLYLSLKGKAATPGHPAAAYVRARTDRSVEIFAHLIERRQQAGLAHPDLDPQEVARQITAIWEGLTAMWAVDETVDVGGLLADGVRRLTAQNSMEMRARIAEPGVGI